MKISQIQDKDHLTHLQIHNGWDLCPYSQILEDHTSKAHKIQKEEYLDEGLYPIVDQGKGAIAGYTNDGTGIYSSNQPVLIFGDHTRIIKYFDQPLYLGADGTKLLVAAKSDVDMKYLYYFIKTVPIPDTGYNRHYKYLKEIVIPLPPIEIQRRIAAALDQAQALIDLRRQQIALLDELVKSVFLEMFGDPVTNPKGWDVTKLETLGQWSSGGTPSRTVPAYFQGNINWYSAGELNERYLSGSKEKISAIAVNDSSANIFSKGSLLVGMYDTAAFKLGILEVDSSSNQACANVEPDPQKCNVDWLYTCFEIMRPFYLAQRRGIRQQNLNLGMIKSFESIIPPLSLQHQFAAIVEQVEVQKAVMEQSLALMEENFNSIMQKAFRGELFS